MWGEKEGEEGEGGERERKVLRELQRNSERYMQSARVCVCVCVFVCVCRERERGGKRLVQQTVRERSDGYAREGQWGR